MFVSVANDDTFHQVAIAALNDPRRRLHHAPVVSSRVFRRRHRDLPDVHVEEIKTNWWAEMFDEQFQPAPAIAVDR